MISSRVPNSTIVNYVSTIFEVAMAMSWLQIDLAKNRHFRLSTVLAMDNMRWTSCKIFAL